MRDSKGRASYRVEYPIQERPVLVVDGLEMAIHDLSDAGIRFATRIEFGIALGDTIRGHIRFRERGEHRVVGEVVWLRHSLAALELEEALPFGMIIAEQEYLSSRYRSPG